MVQAGPSFLPRVRGQGRQQGTRSRGEPHSRTRGCNRGPCLTAPGQPHQHQPLLQPQGSCPACLGHVPTSSGRKVQVPVPQQKLRGQAQTSSTPWGAGSSHRPPLPAFAEKIQDGNQSRSKDGQTGWGGAMHWCWWRPAAGPLSQGKGYSRTWGTGASCVDGDGQVQSRAGPGPSWPVSRNRRVSQEGAHVFSTGVGACLGDTAWHRGQQPPSP